MGRRNEMANPLIKNQAQAAQAVPMAGPQNPMALMSQFMQNPVGALRQAGFSIPDGMSNPQAIVNHLINNGQLGRGRLSHLQNMARMLGRR